MSNKEFSLSEHLRRKSRHEKRVPLALETYDRVLPKVISAIQKAIVSPENDTGVTDVVIFGSWARRNWRTGPTANSDLDLMAYRPTFLDGKGEVKIEEIIQSCIDEENLDKESIHFREIMVWSGLDGDDLVEIKNGDDLVTKHGYIIVSAGTIFLSD